MATVRKRGRRWYARYKGPDGRPLEQVVPGQRRLEAERAAWELEAQAWRVAQGLEVPPVRELVADASARYLRAIRHHRSIVSTESRWRLHILPVLGHVPAAQVRPSQVDDLLAALKDRGYSQQTLKHVRNTLSGFFEWLRGDKAVAQNPVVDTRPVDVPAGEPRVLTEEEVYRVSEAASFDGLRWLILLAFFTAARPGELLAVRWRDVDMDRAQIRIARTLGNTTTKTKRSRTAFLPPPALSLLAEMSARRTGEHLFGNAAGGVMKHRQAARAFKSAMRRAGILRGWEAVCRRRGCGFREERRPGEGERCPRCSFVLFARPLELEMSLKDLRSSSITQIVEATGSLHAASAQAGHASESTTRRHYVKVRKPYVLDAVNRAFPTRNTTQ